MISSPGDAVIELIIKFGKRESLIRLYVRVIEGNEGNIKCLKINSNVIENEDK